MPMDMLKKVQLEDKAKSFANKLSGGQRQRFSIATTLVNNPRVIFLDEPTTGLDPRSRIAMWEIIENLKKRGSTILLTTQYLEEADYLTDRIVIIDQGKVVAQGTSKELKSTIGGGVLEIHVADKQHVVALVEALNVFGPHADFALGIVTIPVKEGTKTLSETIRKIDAANIEISDIELRKPTLDEVFLELTGNNRPVPK